MNNPIQQYREKATGIIVEAFYEPTYGKYISTSANYPFTSDRTTWKKDIFEAEYEIIPEGDPNATKSAPTIR